MALKCHIGDDIGDIPQLLQRADRDDILGRAGRVIVSGLPPPPSSLPPPRCPPRTRTAPAANRCSSAGHRAPPRHNWPPPNRRRCRPVVPTVVGDERVGQRRAACKIIVGSNHMNRIVQRRQPKITARRTPCRKIALCQNEPCGSSRFKVIGFRAIARDDARHMRAVAIGVHQTSAESAMAARTLTAAPALKSGCVASMPVSFTSTSTFEPDRSR